MKRSNYHDPMRPFASYVARQPCDQVPRHLNNVWLGKNASITKNVLGFG